MSSSSRLFPTPVYGENNAEGCLQSLSSILDRKGIRGLRISQARKILISSERVMIIDIKSKLRDIPVCVILVADSDRQKGEERRLLINWPFVGGALWKAVFYNSNILLRKPYYKGSYYRSIAPVAFIQELEACLIV